jgi:hypothetical protein
VKTPERVRKFGISKTAMNNRTALFGWMDVSKVPRLGAVAGMNSRLRRLLLNAMLDVYPLPGCLAEKSRQIGETHSEPHEKKGKGPVMYRLRFCVSLVLGGHAKKTCPNAGGLTK